MILFEVEKKIKTRGGEFGSDFKAIHTGYYCRETLLEGKGGEFTVNSLVIPTMRLLEV